MYEKVLEDTHICVLHKRHRLSMLSFRSGFIHSYLCIKWHILFCRCCRIVLHFAITQILVMAKC